MTGTAGQPSMPETGDRTVRDDVPQPWHAPRRRFVPAGFTRMPRRSLDNRDIREGPSTRAVRRRDAWIRRGLAVADVCALLVAFGAALAVGGQQPRLGLLAAPFLLVLFSKLGGLYDRDEHVIRKSTIDQGPALLQIATTFTLLTWLTSDALVTGELGKAEVFVLWATLLAATVLLRFVARRVASARTDPERILFLGDQESFRRLEARVATAHSLKAVLVGRVSLEERELGAQVLGRLANLQYVLEAHDVNRVIIAPAERTPDEQLDTIRLVKALGVKVSVLPRLFEVVGSSMEFDDVDGISLLGLRRYGLSKTSWFLKRTFDIAVATAGLVVFVPLLVTIALGVRVSSPGPILFRQRRVGRGGEVFKVLKFRTMYDGADQDKADLLEYSDADGLFKLVDDPRVTPVGRFLRRTSLDELPQLVNVLRGEMSMVGPRPLVEEEERKIAGHHRRREGTPGMTGVWQLLGSSRVPLDDMVKMDYLYRANWSLWLDTKILLRTLAHVCGRRGV